ncbi:MAG: hypothetical protein ACE5I3_08695 [Phycisphaerae bacterium]
MKANLLTIAVLLSLPGPLGLAQQGDALDEALALVGMRRADLGWKPKSWWPRFPDVPYKLRAFDALFAEPLDAITFTRSLAKTAWEKLDPTELDQDQGRTSPHTNLFAAVQRLGIDPKFGGFRGYTANVLAPQTPLDEAILKLTEAAHRPTRISTFGMELPYPKPKEELAEKVKALPEGVSPILGQLVLNIIDAHYWAELAFRKVDGDDRMVVATRYNVGEEMIDAFDYCPQIDDVARTWDEASMWYAGQKCVQALDNARIALKKLELKDVPDFAFDWESPWGWIRIRGGGNDRVDGTDILLIVDLGGDDRYFGAVAASNAKLPISLLLDLAGDDVYRSDVSFGGPGPSVESPGWKGTPGTPAQGAGICGVGVLLDNTGNDEYHAVRYAQGVGQFGLGLCADLAGDDLYGVRYSGQGCGYFGIGLLFDAAGDDRYKIYADGQGLGGVAGVGVLADRSGDDEYTAVREHSVTGRPSYHSSGLDVGVSNAQGCGMGRRGDGADGHSWAGGLGALLDGEGDDVYTSGNWSMGTGYWFGIGVLHDRAGNDEYHGAVWSQATGAHFCIGVLIDESGDDQHLTEANANNSIAFAHDFTHAILLDAGGNDIYDARQHGIAYSINRSVAMLIDAGGDDTYKSEKTERPGFAQNRAGFRARDGVSTYFADTTSIGLFLDIGGNDTYWSEEFKNNSHWLDPPDSPNWADRNFSVGVDRADGTVDFTPIPVRSPTGGTGGALSGPNAAASSDTRR